MESYIKFTDYDFIVFNQNVYKSYIRNRLVMKPKVSVIILNWNGKEYLKGCLDSVLSQTYANSEVIVVDNGSTDGSKEFVKKNYKKVRLIENPKNLGFSKANNIGIDSSDGDYVFILNNDTKLNKDFLKQMINVAVENLDVGMFSCKMLFYDKHDIINSTGLKLYTDGTSIDEDFDQKDDGRYEKIKEVFGPCGGAAFYKREMLDDIKLGDEYFDNDFFIYSEDLDLAFRGRLRGWKCLYVPKAKLYHKFRGTTGKISNFGLYYGIKNKIFFIVKDYPLPLLFKNLHTVIVRQLVSALYYLVFFNIAAIRSRVVMLLMLPKMIGKRMRIQRNKKIRSRDIERLLVKRPFLKSLFYRY